MPPDLETKPTDPGLWVGWLVGRLVERSNGPGRSSQGTHDEYRDSSSTLRASCQTPTFYTSTLHTPIQLACDDIVEGARCVPDLERPCLDSTNCCGAQKHLRGGGGTADGFNSQLAVPVLVYPFKFPDPADPSDLGPQIPQIPQI